MQIMVDRDLRSELRRTWQIRPDQLQLVVDDQQRPQTLGKGANGTVRLSGCVSPVHPSLTKSVCSTCPSQHVCMAACAAFKTMTRSCKCMPMDFGCSNRAYVWRRPVHEALSGLHWFQDSCACQHFRPYAAICRTFSVLQAAS